MSQTSESWAVVVRNQEAVVAALAQGKCDGILPDEWLEPDNLVQTALEEGWLEGFETFPDRRGRRSIEAALFCKVWLCGRLVDAPSVAQTGRVVFHSVTLLDKLGFNFRQVREGGKRTGDHRPFDEEALEDYFARLKSLSGKPPITREARGPAKGKGAASVARWGRREGRLPPPGREGAHRLHQLD